MDKYPDPELLARLAAVTAGRELIDRLDGLDGVHLVGGAVRDLLLGGEPQDLDLVVEGGLDAVIERLGAPARVHDRFGTFTVWFADVRCDVARARRESYSMPGALPTVSPAGIEEDLRRRDFTVNALALALGGERRGELVAVPGALTDLEARSLRVLHDGSFLDDPTRLVRLSRYAGRLGFTIEPGTLELAHAAIGGGALGTVSGARIGTELRLAADEPAPAAVFGALRELGVDDALMPGFGIDDAGLLERALALLLEGREAGGGERVGAAREGREGNGGQRDGAARERSTGDPGALVLAVAGLGLPASRFAGLLDRLAMAAAVRDVAVAAARDAPALAGRLGDAGMLPSAIAAAVGGAAPETIALAGALGPAQAARGWLGRLRYVRLSIDGEDLLAAGIAPGPAVGAGLAAARAATLDGRAPDRGSQLEEALRVAAATG